MSSYVQTTRTVNDVLAHVKRQFGDESGVQITNEDIMRWVNAGQDEIFRRPEPVKASISADLVAGQQEYALPDGILRIQTIYVNGYPIEQRSNQEMEEYVRKEDPLNVTTGTPAVWSEWGGSISLFPKPDISAVGGLSLRYIKGPVLVSDATDTLSLPDAYYNRLVEYVLQQAYELDENFAAADTKAAQFTMNLEGQAGKDQVSPNVYPTITVLEEDM